MVWWVAMASAEPLIGRVDRDCGPAETVLSVDVDRDGIPHFLTSAPSEADRCVMAAFPTVPTEIPLQVELRYVPGQGVTATAAPTVLGALDLAAVHGPIRADLADIRRCYQQFLLDTEGPPPGKLVVKIVIGADGAVTSASTKSSTLTDPRIAPCVVDEIRTLRFDPPKGGGIAIVSYPFLF